MVLRKVKSLIAKYKYTPVTLASSPNTYTPTSWEFDLVHGSRVYRDEQLNVMQANLMTLYDLVSDVRVQAEIDLLNVQNNLNTHSIKDPTVETIGWMVAKCFEAGALIFPAGTVTAVAAGLIARMLSGGTQALTRDRSSDSYNAIQSAVNNTRDAMLTVFDNLQELITTWTDDPQSQWLVQQYPLGEDNKELAKPITLSELAAFPDYFPQRGKKTGYDQTRNYINGQVELTVTRKLLPIRFRLRELTGGNDSSRYFWDVSWYETSSTSKWNEWRGRKEFPAIPSDLRDSVGGPWEDIGPHRDIKGGTQYYQGYNNDGFRDDDDGRNYEHKYWWTRMPGRRWMYWGGRNCTSWDASTQGATCDNQIDKAGNVVKGTPFLDLFDDIAQDVKHGYQWYYQNPANKNALVWYRMSDGSINNRQVDHMTCVDYCNDWRYEKNVFKWNWAYRGIRIRIHELVDTDGHTASNTLVEWLFKDDGYGNATNPKGIANKIDVYHNWGVPTY